jgi:hypothetical protein
MGDMTPFGAAGDVKKPSHVERESAIMPPVYVVCLPASNAKAAVDQAFGWRDQLMRASVACVSMSLTFAVTISVAKTAA